MNERDLPPPSPPSDDEPLWIKHLRDEFDDEREWDQYRHWLDEQDEGDIPPLSSGTTGGSCRLK